MYDILMIVKDNICLILLIAVSRNNEKDESRKVMRIHNQYHNHTVAQTRHFIKHLLHDFTKHLLHDFTISSTILQFPPRFYNFLHDFTKHLLHDFTISSTILQNICSTILQFPPRFYNFLHDFTISSTILQFPPRFCNFLHYVTCKIVEEIVISWRKL